MENILHPNKFSDFLIVKIFPFNHVSIWLFINIECKTWRNCYFDTPIFPDVPSVEHFRVYINKLIGYMLSQHFYDPKVVDYENYKNI